MSIFREKQFVNDVKTLELHIILLGYKVEGESVLVFIKDRSTDSVLFSMMIDCYADNLLNKSREILEEYKIKTLNYFIWTHPDNDHSVDIVSILNTYTSKDTVIILPEGVTNGPKLSASATAAINHINLIGGRKQNYQVKRVSAHGSSGQCVFKQTCYSDSLASIDFEFYIVAPDSAILGKRTTAGKRCKLNDFSIGISLIFNGLNFFLGGDVEDQSLRLIPDCCFQNVEYIKIPHHCSLSSASLIERLSNSSNLQAKRMVATTTVYNKHKLPNQALLNKYKTLCSEVYSTGSGVGGFGYIKTVYNIIDVSNNTELFGDAVSIT